MHTAEFIIIGVLAAVVVVALLVHFGWSISTQHRDHGVATSGSLPQRHIWSRRRPRPHAGPVNAEAIPGDSIPAERDPSAGVPTTRT